jgi:hypothetical protein
MPGLDGKQPLFWEAENKEEEYLRAAQDYLEKKGIIDWKTSSEVADLVYDRKSKLEHYRIKERERLMNEINAFQKRMEDRAKRGHNRWKKPSIKIWANIDEETKTGDQKSWSPVSWN